MKVKNKVLAVTGGGSGIGKELVLALLRKGARVAALDMNESALKELAKDAAGFKKNLATFVLNITDRKAVDRVPNEVRKKFGHVDGIINNAGIIQPFVKVNELDLEAIERVMNVNFYGTVYMVKAFLPHLLKRNEAHIVNVSSMGGFLPVPGQSVYGASKAAVKLLTEGLYAELKNTGVRVTVVFPGATETNITKNSGLKNIEQSTESGKKQSFPMLSPKEVAKQIINGVEKNKLQVFTGKDSNFMNLLYRFNPVFATNFIAKKMASLLEK